MSKDTYIRGFRKAAMNAGVNPEALAKYALDKGAQAAPAADGGFWNSVKKAIDAVKGAHNGLPEDAKQALKVLGGAGVGALAGTAAGGVMKRPGKGAALGSIAGGLYGLSNVDWKAIYDAIGKRADPGWAK